MDPRVEQRGQHGHDPCWEGCRGGFLGHQHVTTCWARTLRLSSVKCLLFLKFSGS